MDKLQVGDRVKFTGQFLRNTGQFYGSEGMSEWVVAKCDCDLCSTGRFVATNQNADTFEPLRIGQESPMRHINAGNLRRIKTRV